MYHWGQSLKVYLNQVHQDNENNIHIFSYKRKPFDNNKNNNKETFEFIHLFFFKLPLMKLPRYNW